MSQQTMEKIQIGPWLGTMRSRAADAIPPEYMNQATNFLYLPKTGFFKRCSGRATKFETVGTETGLLPAHWSATPGNGARSRQLHEFLSESITDGVPTLLALVSRETIESGLDDGRFSQVYIRNQVDNVNYTLGSEFDSSSYPAPAVGVEQIYKVVPLWYESGDGGLTRGVTEFARRFFQPGSRTISRVGAWWYAPSRFGTPSRWRGNFRTTSGSSAATNRNRLIPSGPIPPTHVGSWTAGTASPDGTFQGKDRFAVALAYRFEDDSIWMPTKVRLPSTYAPSGVGIVTVDSANPATKYNSMTITLFPQAPHGVKSIVVCRGPKVDSTGANAFNINPNDLRPVMEVPVGTTTVEFTAGDDARLMAPELAEAILRQDLSMPPRARYNGAGPQRVFHAYGGLNPCAIEIAPLSREVAGDCNTDDIGSAYEGRASYMRIFFDPGGTAWTLDLIKTDLVPAVSGTISLSLTTYNTLDKLVDKINSTTLAVDGQEWRAQLLDPTIGNLNPVDVLVPHARAIDACAVDNTAKTIVVAGASSVAVGARIIRAGVATDAYVTRIDSATQLTFTGTVTTSASVDLIFYFDMGDSPTAGLANLGYQRVIANSLPGFLYFSVTYLNKFPIDKQAVWLTTANPGSTQAAANMFTFDTATAHRPITPAAGIVQGVVAVDNGFCVFYEKKRAAIRNTRDMGTGLDSDYHLFMTNENSGCSSWNTVCAGNRFAVAMAQEGIVACDLFNERLISEAIWTQSPALGDFSNQIATELAASAADNDSSRMVARVLRAQLWVGFRVATPTATPNRWIVYDFSNGLNNNGLGALLRDDGTPWGWSGQVNIHTMAALVEARRSDGSHLYGWSDSNLAADGDTLSTGDGQIYEFEVGDTDAATSPATAITASIITPWLIEHERYSAHELICDHDAPTGSTGTLVFARALEVDSYTLTPTVNTAGLEYVRDRKMLPINARCPAYASRVTFTQATGPARTLRRLRLEVEKNLSYT
jgi:hypothetical protein